MEGILQAQRRLKLENRAPGAARLLFSAGKVVPPRLPVWLRTGGLQDPARGHPHAHGGAGAWERDPPAADGAGSGLAGRRGLERTEPPQLYSSQQGEVGPAIRPCVSPRAGRAWHLAV